MQIPKKQILELKNRYETLLSDLNGKYQAGLKTHSELEKQIGIFRDTLEISEYGLYESKFSFDLPEQYKLELEHTYQLQKHMVASGHAVTCFTKWEVAGSLVEGKKMTKNYMKLMLYAFNGECDSLIAKVKWNNISKMELRILQTFNNINKLGHSHSTAITTEYKNLKQKEIAEVPFSIVSVTRKNSFL